MVRRPPPHVAGPARTRLRSASARRGQRRRRVPRGGRAVHQAAQDEVALPLDRRLSAGDVCHGRRSAGRMPPQPATAPGLALCRVRDDSPRLHLGDLPLWSRAGGRQAAGVLADRPQHAALAGLAGHRRRHRPRDAVVAGERGDGPPRAPPDLRLRLRVVHVPARRPRPLPRGRRARRGRHGSRRRQAAVPRAHGDARRRRGFRRRDPRLLRGQVADRLRIRAAGVGPRVRGVPVVGQAAVAVNQDQPLIGEGPPPGGPGDGPRGRNSRGRGRGGGRGASHPRFGVRKWQSQCGFY